MQENTALQKKLTDTQKQLDSLQQQWQVANQQLDEKAQQLEQLRTTQKNDTTDATDLKKSQAESQKQIAALKEEISTLTAAQVTNQLELAAAKTRESQDIVQLKKLLADTQDQKASMSAQIATLTASQVENAKALAAAKAGGTEAVGSLKQSLNKSQSESAELKKSLVSAQNEATVLSKRIAELTAAQTAQTQAQTAAKADADKVIAQLKISLTESQNQATALNKQVTELTAAQTANAKAQTAAKADADKVIAQLKTSLSESQAQTAALNKQVDTLQAASKAAPIATAAPDSDDKLRAYSLGTLWGQEIRGALANVQADGFTPDLTQVVSGVSDSLSGEFKIPKEKIMAQLDTMNKQVLARQKQSSETAESEGDKFITDFSKQTGVKKAEMGYYYRVLDAGRGKIKHGEVVAVSVKESLSNGNVIKDMAKTKQVVTLPLDQFPPVFASSIGLVGSHGKVQIVVPPELAYGDRGQPPQIPPKATMVYEITVQDVKPAQAK
ncbi:FKBP-type peptidyl-prolyl cis-trans isomerase N-terminal domain-containing protein [Scandinavium sp. V105_16]|uniref:peptidylprolyl isomerase n=1 Tax=Scandinavium lactucae TaxID=3095028 RepID=A0AAJ2VRP2_9ENTR|nr:FKBP-type peptidyl-prolyl cis-trans isomerase N-terminal domain-containing protein [Scandinavium sp. V105_16]MDX6018832.1 FKBP-type peptidyl-prolyl cis-trans isomerase N-terminal domain-containing protein [Scandinavium sp. V105_16]MDX6030206.1 FKBP-type peptidyl-prolyl cis-trans isomerase N-terminal domain-containing protein [Scandinavium sp. V105_12]